MQSNKFSISEYTKIDVAVAPTRLYWGGGRGVTALPGILISWTRVIGLPEITEGGTNRDPLLLGLTNTVSDLNTARFHRRLLLLAQLSMLLSSNEHERIGCSLGPMQATLWSVLILREIITTRKPS